MNMMNSLLGTPAQPTLSIEQLLRAAKLIEQRAIEKLIVSQPIDQTAGFAAPINAFPMAKLGGETRLIFTKTQNTINIFLFRGLRRADSLLQNALHLRRA